MAGFLGTFSLNDRAAVADSRLDTASLTSGDTASICEGPLTIATYGTVDTWTTEGSVVVSLGLPFVDDCPLKAEASRVVDLGDIDGRFALIRFAGGRPVRRSPGICNHRWPDFGRLGAGRSGPSWDAVTGS